jgi:glycosyltransferase involved in cell wall biosynthesis
MARILHVVDSTGPGEAPAALLRLLRHLDRARWEPAVVALGPADAALERVRALGIDVLALAAGEDRGPLAALQLALDARRLPRLLGGRRFDLVHARGPAAELLARLATRRLGSRALVASFDGTAPHLDWWRRRTDRRTAGRVTRFVLPAAALEPALRARPGGEAARCSVIPDGIDLAEADAALAIGRDAARRRLGLFATDVAVAHVGALDAQGGAVQLLAAFHALLQVQPTARLLIAGEGPARAALQAAAASLRLGPFARFLGAVPATGPLLAAADIFALPALRGGTPFALLEAMAAGLPVVATAAGAVAEIVADGREALLVPPGDAGALGRALAELAASPQRRRARGALARLRVEETHRIERTVAGIERLYDELLAAAGAGG